MQTTVFTVLVCVVALVGCSEQAQEQIAGSSNKPAAAGSAPQATVSTKQKASNSLQPPVQTPDSSALQGESGSLQQEQQPAANATRPADRQENNETPGEPTAENRENQIAETKVEDSTIESDEAINRLDAHQAEVSSSNEYTVKAGDTLTKIARNHNTKVQALVDLNELSNPGEIAVGEKLRLPSQ